MQGCIVRIRQGLETFSPTEKKIGEFILKNTQEFLGYSITQLAIISETSEASIVRFCKSIGLKGYQELKICISADLAMPLNSKVKIYEQVSNDDSIQTIINKVSQGNINAIEDTMKVLDSEELSRAISSIDKARKIAIFGAGASSIVAMDAQYKFMRINIEANMYFDMHMQLTVASNLEECDVALGISNSGGTIDVIKALEIARGNGAKTICITQFGNSPIVDVSDIKLFTACVENNLRSGAMASRIAQLNIIDSIFVGVACRRYEDVLNCLDRTRDVVKDKKY